LAPLPARGAAAPPRPHLPLLVAALRRWCAPLVARLHRRGQEGDGRAWRAGAPPAGGAGAGLAALRGQAERWRPGRKREPAAAREEERAGGGAGGRERAGGGR
ncbi:hypothetical protein BAE44_0003720, partial [Dichanthelium oligosanthes]